MTSMKNSVRKALVELAAGVTVVGCIALGVGSYLATPVVYMSVATGSCDRVEGGGSCDKLPSRYERVWVE